MSGYDDRDLLTTTLRDRAGDMDGHTLGLDDVKGRARGIQRRRRTATALAVTAVAVAAAVPIGLTAPGLDRGTGPVQPATQSPSVSASPTPEVPTGPVEVDAAAAPRGEDPAILYLTGTTLHRLDGSQVELPRQYSYVLPYADGVMGFYGPEATTDFVGADGRLTSQGTYRGLSGAISSDGERIATWIDATGGADLALWPREGAGEDGYTSNVVAFEGDLQLAGFVGRETVAYNLIVPGDQGATTTPYVADWTSEPRELTSVLFVRTANDVTGYVTGMTKIDDLKREYCAAVVEAATDSVVWETCEHRLDRFSPDGRYVLGVDPQSDGLGPSAATVLDAETGEVVAEFTLGRSGFFSDLVWESATTILAPVMQDGTWTMVRLRTDGTVEQALDPTTEGYEDSSLWRFQYVP